MSAFIDEQRETDAVEFICQTIGVSAYCDGKVRGPPARALRHAELLEQIRETHEKHYFAGCGRRCCLASFVFPPELEPTAYVVSRRANYATARRTASTRKTHSKAK